MEIILDIMVIDGKYIHELEGDGTYYFLYELAYDNIKNFPPRLFTDNDVNSWTDLPDDIDLITGNKFSPRDVIFKEIKIII